MKALFATLAVLSVAAPAVQAQQNVWDMAVRMAHDTCTQNWYLHEQTNDAMASYRECMKYQANNWYDVFGGRRQ